MSNLSSLFSALVPVPYTESALIVAILMVLPTSNLSDQSSVSCIILCLSFLPVFSFLCYTQHVCTVSVTLFFRFFALDDDGSIVGVLHLTKAMVRPDADAKLPISQGVVCV